MHDSLDKVFDIAKKLRSLAKKTNDSKVMDLVTDLNLSLADLRVELVEERQQQQQQGRTQTQHTTQTTQTTPTTTQDQQKVPVTTGSTTQPTDEDLDFTY